MTQPTTTARRISDAMRARMRLHEAWFEAHPNQPMPEGRAQVERLLEAIEAEARAEATRALREALEATVTLPEDAPRSGSFSDSYENGWRDRAEAIRAALSATEPASEPPSETRPRCVFTFGLSDGTRCQAIEAHPIHHGVDDGPDYAHPFVSSTPAHATGAPAGEER